MPDRSNFFSMRLATEATAVASKIAAYLATFIHLCPDPCHKLNLMMKDVMLGSAKYLKIKGFTKVTYFDSQLGFLY